MRHLKRRSKLGKTGSHKRCMIANMLKSLIISGRIETTIVKGKELKRHADKMITIAKKDTISARRLAKAKLMIRYNPLTPKERREVKQNDFSSYNNDRKVLNKLFDDLKNRYDTRNGGYTRLIKTDESRVGDGTRKCLVEYLN